MGSMLLTLLASVIVAVVSGNALVKFNRNSVYLLAPPSEIKHLTLGFREVISDTLWLRVIQDYNICGTDPNEKSINDLRIQNLEVPECKMGWTYKMLNAITDLTPRNRLPFATGATVLSVLVNDPTGAAAIFEKSLKYFPNDWSIQYRAGYHYLAELKNEVRAAEWFALAGKNGAPIWVNMLGARLATNHGKSMIAKAMLEEYRRLDPNADQNPRFLSLMKKAEEGLAAAEKGENPKPENSSPGANDLRVPSSNQNKP